VHHANRGHHLQDLIPKLQQAALKFDGMNASTFPQPNSNTLYIHQMYHPNGLQRANIREAYNTTLKPVLNFEKMMVTISRPRNLRDILTKTSLIAPLSLDIQRLLT
jgi:hypothetical protein